MIARYLKWLRAEKNVGAASDLFVVSMAYAMMRQDYAQEQFELTAPPCEISPDEVF